MIKTKVFSVTEINIYIKSILQNDIILSGLYVKGEISNLKIHGSGHVYFTLKDFDSRIKCVMFKSSFARLGFIPEDGLAVVVRGYFSVYERDGQYQLYAEDIIPEGTGALYKAYEQLKKRLAEDGYFDEELKKELPFMPQSIGVVTSPTGAAVRDIISIIRRRAPFVNIILYPVQVQGETAPGEICDGIRYFNRERNVDVIIAGRGGGSIEELWAFNEEIVARAIFESRIPVVSAVGHETDYTIADFVSDLRAPTPSAAAELVVPDRQSLRDMLSQLSYRLNTAMSGYMQEQRTRVNELASDNVFRQIEQNILNHSQYLERLDKALHDSMKDILKDYRTRLSSSIGKIDILNPASVLLRGYARVLRPDGVPLASVEQTTAGDRIQIELRDGSLEAEILDIKRNGE